MSTNRTQYATDIVAPKDEMVIKVARKPTPPPPPPPFIISCEGAAYEAYIGIHGFEEDRIQPYDIIIDGIVMTERSPYDFNASQFEDNGIYVWAYEASGVMRFYNEVATRSYQITIRPRDERFYLLDWDQDNQTIMYHPDRHEYTFCLSPADAAS